ncbi:MAG: hypothetical protein ACI9MC_001369 [Kiritimatiellia bacterium]|jgi:hypothetical protein
MKIMLVCSLLCSTLAFAEDEKEAPHYLLGEVGVRVDLPEKQWESKRWSDWDLVAQSEDAVVLVAWTTDYQVHVTEAELDGWTTVYVEQAKAQGGLDPQVVSKTVVDFRGTPSTAFELSMDTEKKVPLTMLVQGFPVKGMTFHIATVAMTARKDAARKALDGALERLEVNQPAEALSWGGAVTATGFNAELDSYWRVPSKAEMLPTMASIKRLNVHSLKGCWTAIHPHAAGRADLLVTCQDTRQVFDVVDELTFADQEQVLRDAWLGEDIAAGEQISVSGRVGFYWDANVGQTHLQVGAVPNELGLAKTTVLIDGGDAATVGAAARATMAATAYSAPAELDFGALMRYYLAYRPFSPLVIGPIVVSFLVLLSLIGLMIFGLRKQKAMALAMADEDY